MKKFIFAAAITVSLAPIALAQTSAPTGAPSGTATSSDVERTAPDLARASRVLRQNVYNQNGDAVGSINELIIDPHSGQIQQAIIGVGGVLGIGQKLVALPFNQLTVKTITVSTTPAPGEPVPLPVGNAPARAPQPEEHFVIDMTKDQLKAAPEYHYPQGR